MESATGIEPHTDVQTCVHTYPPARKSITLMEHQRKMVEIARQHPRYAFFWACGTGKSAASLAVISDAKDRGFVGKTLILAPKSVMRAAWESDVKFFPDLKLVTVWSDKPAERVRLINTAGADILVTNYETFKRHAEDFYRAGVTRLVIDESSKVKAHNSQISKACHAFADKMQSVYLLSGTPAPNDRTEYWSQMRCIDPTLFGYSFFRFTSTYFVAIKRKISGKERIIGWRPSSLKEPEFFEKLGRFSWSLTKDQALDLPEKQDIVREAILDDGEFNAYCTMLAECKAELKTGTYTPAIAAKMMKLRQITGGAMYVGDTHEVFGRSKLDAMRGILEEIGERKVVIWAEFSFEIDRIVEEVKAMGLSVGVIDGRVDANDRFDLVQQFQDGDLMVLVCQPQAAGHGITLTASNYAIYYSHGFSFETFEQSRDRIHRKGQRNVCTYYHIVAPGTVDERVLKALRTKGDAHEEVMGMLSERDEGETAAA